jgi:tetratricopeptide (TPR) repeat protein
MASLIPGFEYDIFISYRQKDNKHDGWVTEFVNQLKGELEATFKEDISVYFDENPHDRLQETYNVSKSLEGKLKCLIFIPILSQTYCDPASYAWQYEFLAFLRMAENDHFGKDIKLRSGNVASRILPIRIHDLDLEDVKLFEKATGNVIRTLDFVFRTASGAKRPLASDEDHPNDNLYKTYYRDQINKVAIAIKEIVLGMKAEPVMKVEEKDQPKESFRKVREEEKKIEKENPAKTVKSKLLSTVAVLTILIIAGILAYPKIFKRNSLEKLRSSGEKITVAVIPFQNMTNDTTWNIWQDGIQEMLITTLSDNPEDLIIRQSESIKSLIQSKGITNYAGLTPSIAGKISQKLNTNIFIYGSIQKAGNKLRINAKLIDTKTAEVLKSLEIEGINKEESIFDVTDSLRKKVTDFLLISKIKKELPLDVQPFTSSYTNSPIAYRYFMYGNKAFDKYDMPTAIKSFLQALAIDTNFNFAALRLASAYNNNGDFGEGKKWCLRAYRKREQMPIQLKLWANRTYAIFFETPYEEIKYYRQLLEIDDQLPMVYYGIGRDYLEELYQFDKAIPEFEKALEIYNKWGLKPSWVLDYIQLGRAYHKTGQYKKEKEIYKKAEQDFPDHFFLLENQAILSLVEGDTVAANRYIEKFISTVRENTWSDQDVTTNLAWIYSEAGIMDKSEEYYRKALSFEPDNVFSLNHLAYFLIENDRNIDEGLKLVDKALKFSPDNFECLNTKGWCLYKQGKYQNALEILQKSWDLRRQNAVYDLEAFLHLEAAKKAVASQKNN